MKKALLKRISDALEKLSIGSALIGIFQQNPLGVQVGIACMLGSIILTIWEAKS